MSKWNKDTYNHKHVYASHPSLYENVLQPHRLLSPHTIRENKAKFRAKPYLLTFILLPTSDWSNFTHKKAAEFRVIRRDHLTSLAITANTTWKPLEAPGSPRHRNQSVVPHTHTRQPVSWHSSPGTKHSTLLLCTVWQQIVVPANLIRDWNVLTHTLCIIYNSHSMYSTVNNFNTILFNFSSMKIKTTVQYKVSRAGHF